MFNSCHRYVIVKLAERLQTMFAMAGDEICKQGMVGHQMYFIEQGVVTIHVSRRARQSSFSGETAAAVPPPSEDTKEIGTLTARASPAPPSDGPRHTRRALGVLDLFSLAGGRLFRGDGAAAS